MYQEFYNLSAEPFRLSPDYNFAYSHKGYSKAWAYMEYAFMRAEGFVMITGKPGIGKTTLIGALVNKLSNSPVTIANLVCTQLQADDLLKIVAYEFGVPVSVVSKGELLHHLTKQLKLWHSEGRRALLIVDEAQDLSISAMEELRLLTNIQVNSQPLLQIFLLGQPELRSLILSPQLEQVRQRIIAGSHIKPLEKDETEAYIRHRLLTVHWRGDPAISKAVYPLIYKFSEGIPRRINLICSRLLLHCSAEQKHQVVAMDVREVIEELQSEDLASGDSFSEMDFQIEDVFDDVILEEKTADTTPEIAEKNSSSTDNTPVEADTKPTTVDSSPVAAEKIPARTFQQEGRTERDRKAMSGAERATSTQDSKPHQQRKKPAPKTAHNLDQKKKSSGPWFLVNPWVLVEVIVIAVILVAVISIPIILVTYGDWI